MYTMFYNTVQFSINVIPYIDNGWYNSDMALLTFFSWWYGPGWKNSFARITQRVDSIAAELSIGLLLKTLFEPWKQITSHSGPNDSIDVKIHAWFDTLFARMVGFVIRSSVLVFGAIASIFAVLFGTILAILWPLIPLLPVLFVMLTVVQL